MFVVVILELAIDWTLYVVCIGCSCLVLDNDLFFIVLCCSVWGVVVCSVPVLSINANAVVIIERIDVAALSIWLAVVYVYFMFKDQLSWLCLILLLLLFQLHLLSSSSMHWTNANSCTNSIIVPAFNITSNMNIIDVNTFYSFLIYWIIGVNVTAGISSNVWFVFDVVCISLNIILYLHLTH